MHVGCLGPLVVRSGETSVAVGGTRLRTLLIRLAMDAGRTVSVASLCSALWPHEGPADSGHAVQALVSRLRKALPRGMPLRSTEGGYCLDIVPDAVDALRFEALAREGSMRLQKGNLLEASQALEEAIGLWRGDALAGMADSAYAAGAVARLTELRLTAMEDCATAVLALGSELPGLIAELESLVSLHPHRERLRALLVRALHADGRSAEALAAYEHFRSWLADHLGADPSPDLQEAHLSVLRGRREKTTQPRSAPEHRRDNLRSELTSFIGRGEETEQLGKQLTAHRLVTLVGTGGTGKTRLATAVASEIAETTPGGVWLVELAAVTDEQDVAPAVLAALGSRGLGLSGAPGSGRDVTDLLVEVASAAETLLLLDSCEHVLDPVAHLAHDLLGRCPRLRILATSREPLGILGESLLTVPPLTLPEPGVPAPTAARSPAVRLFADRASAVRPDFAVTPENVSAVVEICRQLDGLPLAIELAAARLRTLSVDQLAVRLDDRFQVLTSGSRTAQPRHRTLRAVVAWGWDLLDADERRLAEALSVFTSTVTLEAADAVGGLGDRTLDTLTSLVEKSVVHVVDGPEMRFRMLETLRAFGLERLAASGGLQRARRAHARFFVGLAASAEPHLRRGAGQVRWTRVLTADRDNLLAALHFACESEDGDTALRLGAALSYYWTQRGEYAQAAHLLGTALGLAGDADPPARPVAATGYLLNSILAGRASSVRSDLVAPGPHPPDGAPDSEHPALPLAVPLLAWACGDSALGMRAIDARPPAPDPWTRAMLWLIRSMFSMNDGCLQEGCRDLQRSADEFRVIGERWGLAMSLTYLAVGLMAQGEYGAAVTTLTEARGPARELGGDDPQRVWLAVAHRHTGQTEAARGDLQAVITNPSSASHLRLARLNLGDLARLEGDVREAARQYALARDACAQDAFDDAAFGVLYWTATGRLSITEDDLPAGHCALEAALRGALEATDMLLVAMVGAAVAHLLHRCHAPEPAAALLGACHALRGASDIGNPDIAQLQAALAEELGEPARAAAYADGCALGRDDAVALIRSGLDHHEVRARTGS